MATNSRPLLIAACAALAVTFLAVPQACVGPPVEDASRDAGKDGGSGEDAGVFVLEPHAPFEAISGELLIGQTELATTGGQRPFAWNIESRDALLGWLQISSTGVLGGRAGGATSGARFTVAVTDSRAWTARQDFSILVRGCFEGEVSACDPQPDGIACAVGQKVCDGGLYGPCDRSAPVSSWTTASCGADCGQCNPTSANKCDGVCLCQDQPECDGGLTCCATIESGDKCRDVNSDPAHCGTCANDCTASIPSNANFACTDGGCEYPCIAPYARCDGGWDCSNNLEVEVANCGACGNACRAPAGSGSGVPTCAQGGCDVVCNADSNECGSPPDCQLKTDRQHCGGCDIPCPQSPPHVDAGTVCNGVSCLGTCDPGFANCDSTWADGCEANLKTDDANCGTCSHGCTSPYACDGGQCCWHCDPPAVGGTGRSVECCGSEVCDACLDELSGKYRACCM